MNQSHIGALRKARGWTQERLAHESGVATRTIQRLEAGKDAGVETLSMIANALGVPVGDLFATVEDEEFQATVDGLDARRSAQQERRDATTHSFSFLYQGMGILVTFATIALVLTDTLPWPGWLIIPAYWAGGRYLLSFLWQLAIDPRLDLKYPLSRPSPLRGSRAG